MYIRPRLSDQQVVTGGRDSYRIVLDRSKEPPSGANGIVFTAHSSKTGDKVAVKLFSPRDEAVEEKIERSNRLFKNEMKKVQSISHWNVISVLDSGKAEIEGRTLPFTVMEFVPQSLRDRLAGPFSLLTKLFYCAQLTDAVAYLNWRGGFIHRDIKPENILITADGLVKLSDLGIARILPDFERRAINALSLYPEIAGREMPGHYFSPEQLRHLQDQSVDLGRSDIFQLGKVVHEIFTGINPVGQINIDNEIYRTTPKHLRIAIQKMLSENPDDRPQLEHTAALLWVTLGIALADLFKSETKLTEEAKGKVREWFVTADSLAMSHDSFRMAYEGFWNRSASLKRMHELGYVTFHSPDATPIEPRSIDYWEPGEVVVSLTASGMDVRSYLLKNDQWENFLKLYSVLGRAPTRRSVAYGRKVLNRSVRQWDMGGMCREIPKYVFLQHEQDSRYLLPPIAIGNRWWIEILGSANLTETDGRSPYAMEGYGYEAPWSVVNGETKEDVLSKTRTELIRRNITKQKVRTAVRSLERLTSSGCINVVPIYLDWELFLQFLSASKRKPLRLRVEIPSSDPRPSPDIYVRVEVQRSEAVPNTNREKETSLHRFIKSLFKGVTVVKEQKLDDLVESWIRDENTDRRKKSFTAGTGGA
jgi:serine/threonine protein kinase